MIALRCLILVFIISKMKSYKFTMILLLSNCEFHILWLNKFQNCSKMLIAFGSLLTNTQWSYSGEQSLIRVSLIHVAQPKLRKETNQANAFLGDAQRHFHIFVILRPAGNHRFWRSGRPRRPQKPFQKVGGFATHLLEWCWGPPGPQKSRIPGRA